VREALPLVVVSPARALPLCCHFATKSASQAANVPPESRRGQGMSDQISPKFHAELIVVLFDEYRDLRKVTERVGVLLSDASAEHIEAVGKYLPIDLTRALPQKILRAA
jgi:hypothetical protein